MKTYLDTESAKTAFEAVKSYTDNKVASIPEATILSPGLMPASDKLNIQNTRSLGTFTLLGAHWDSDKLSQVVTVPGAHVSNCTMIITPKTRADANYWIDYGIYYDDTFVEKGFMKFTCTEIPLENVQFNVSSLYAGA